MIKDITKEDLFHYENEDLNKTNLQDDNVEIGVLDLLFSDEEDVIVQPVLNNKISEKEYDGFAQYSIAIRNIPQCQPEESIELAKQFQEGSISASSFNTERNMFQKELIRINEFAELAKNGTQTKGKFLELRKKYNLLGI